ncbi:MAG: 3-methyl-2-oxobutanoate hydroxymethyltransferase, partial [Verrucomicrobiota bacterium]
MTSRKSASKITVRTLRRMHRDQEKITALTAYDAWMAKLSEEAGVHLLLVGDSLGMTMLGYKTTIPVTLEQSLHHTAAVARGATRPLIVGDMPFLTYHCSEEQALTNAGRYLQEAGADAVKLEGGQSMAPTVRRLVTAGIPVLGHVGILPQSILAEGGYRVHGRTAEEGASLTADVEALQDA